MDHDLATLVGGRQPRRIAVAGCSGAGKSTLSRKISAALDVPYTEMDSLFHGPNWTPRTQFLDDVTAILAQPAWVCEWQYQQARQPMVDAADLLIWLDLPKALVMRQVTQRTISRRVHREELWNGNVEGSLCSAFTDRDHIIRWAWRTHARARQQVLDLAKSHPDLSVVRVASHAEADDVVSQLASLPKQEH